MINGGKSVDKKTLDYIKKHFQLHEDGSITRTDRANSNGSYDNDGYLILKIKGKQYKAHRVAYALYYGHFPKGEIDHINRNRSDNRIENIRVVDRETNLKNVTKKPNKDTGVVGIHLTKMDSLKKKYTFKLKGKTHRFYSLEEAIEKRKALYE